MQNFRNQFYHIEFYVRCILISRDNAVRMCYDPVFVGFIVVKQYAPRHFDNSNAVPCADGNRVLLIQTDDNFFIVIERI